MLRNLPNLTHLLMDNLQAVAEEFARFYYQFIVPLKAQIAESKEELVTSGNENHYVYWAKQVQGVGNARAVGVRDGSGEVLVSIVTDAAGTPDQDLLDRVAAHIAQQRPVGAKPIIVAASAISVKVAGTVKLKPGYSVEEVTEVFKRRLQAHLLEITFSKSTPNLSYHMISSLLFAVDGVEDVPDYTINGEHDSILGTYDQYFQLEEVSLVGA